MTVFIGNIPTRRDVQQPRQFIQPRFFFFFNTNRALCMTRKKKGENIIDDRRIKCGYAERSSSNKRGTKGGLSEETILGYR